MSMRCLIAVGLCVVVSALAAASGDSDARPLPNLNNAALVDMNWQPSVRGKYRVLLRKLYMPQEEASYTRFRDFGLWQGTAYGQWNDLPLGYWVYQYPYWYIWRDCVRPEPEAAAAVPQGGPVEVGPLTK